MEHNGLTEKKVLNLSVIRKAAMMTSFSNDSAMI